MKTSSLFALFLLACSPISWAQGLQPVTPDKMPNAAELAYFGGKHPDFQPYTVSDPASVQLVKNFLTELMDGLFESAQSRLAEGFRAYGPGPKDELGANDLIRQSDQSRQRFMIQELTVDMSKTVTVARGPNRGRWVYVRGVWSAIEGCPQDCLIRLPFHFLASVDGQQLLRAYISYGTDQLFYDLGLSLSASPLTVNQKR